MSSNAKHDTPSTIHRSPIEGLLAIMAKLRNPEGGCPWDLEQNFATIAPYTIEEAYEVADAITRGDMNELRDELGDLLLQVVFHAQMAAEAGDFTFDEVVKSISEKMIRRHPHVFGDATIQTAEAQTANWEAIKEQERKSKLLLYPPAGAGSHGVHPHPPASAGSHGVHPHPPASAGPSLSLSLTEGEGTSVARGEGEALTHYRTLDNIPTALPALMRAQKLQARAARVGFDWPEVSGVIAKIREELMEVEQALITEDKAAVTDELGDLLFAVTNLARFVGADAETCLRGTNAKFTRRFEYIEDELKKRSKTPAESNLNEMGALWDEAKQLEKEHP